MRNSPALLRALELLFSPSRPLFAGHRSKERGGKATSGNKELLSQKGRIYGGP